MSSPKIVQDLSTKQSGVASLVEKELAKTGGLLRLAPCWVPRSFLQPGSASSCTRMTSTPSA